MYWINLAVDERVSEVLLRQTVNFVSELTDCRLINTLWTGDADLRLCKTTVEDG